MKAGTRHFGYRMYAGTAALLFFLTTHCVLAADWPQFRGPRQDGRSTDRLNKQWTGPVTNPVWLVTLGGGLCSFSVSGGRAFTQTSRANELGTNEVCLALNPANGLELWATVVDTALYPNGGVGKDDGPRSTPTVDGDSVYVLTSHLKLYRMNVTNGAVLWQKDLTNLYNGTVIEWQNAASPVVENGLIFVNANAGSSRIMAFRTSDGSLVWRSQNDTLAWSSPVLATIQGVRQVIFTSQNGLVSLNPTNGTRLWRYSHNSGLTAPSPIVHGDTVCLVTANTRVGAFAFQVLFSGGVWTTNWLWQNTNISSRWMSPVCHQGYLYGLFKDSSIGPLKCIDLATGTERWSTNNFGRGGTLLVDNHLLVVTETGWMALVQPNPGAYTELARFRAISNYSSSTNKCWNIPAVAEGRVYVRSTWFAACYDLSVPALKLDPPELSGPNKLRLAIRTVTGAAVDSNRLPALEIYTTTNLQAHVSSWVRLPNNLALSNGVVRAEDIGATSPGYFIVREPQ